MRTQMFLNYLAANMRLDPHKIEYFSTDQHFRGGWEAWLQCEIGSAMRRGPGRWTLEREVAYPGQIGFRADFKITNTEGLGDQTYVELKAMNSQNPADRAWDQFGADINKVRWVNHRDATIVCQALLAVHGHFDAHSLSRPVIQNNLGGFSQSQVYIIDYANPMAPRVTPLRDVHLNPPDRLFIVGAGSP